MAGFESILQRMCLSTGERLSGRLWRKLKVVISEKDLDRMRDTIRFHVSALNIELTLLQSNHISFSTRQSSEIIELLKQLKSDAAEHHNLRHSASNETVIPRIATEPTVGETGGVGEGDYQAAEAIDTRLEESVARLMRIVKEKECTVELNDTEQLLDDLQTLFESAQKTDAELMCPAMIVSQQRKRKAIEMINGTFTITTNKRRKKCAAPQGYQNVDANGPFLRDFIANISFKPTNFSSSLNLSLHQAQILCGSTFSPAPTFSLNNTLPSNSPIFALAKEGSLQALKSLLATGKASLRDYDTDGWSLLHVGDIPTTLRGRLIYQITVRGVLEQYAYVSIPG
ncbi:MAG: hypothetical protein M1820_009090 [Bogoriella megaspora]|nr:MAG: hypothetical protein M1820_009090 [Bogoriella megaspora]